MSKISGPNKSDKSSIFKKTITNVKETLSMNKSNKSVTPMYKKQLIDSNVHQKFN